MLSEFRDRVLAGDAEEQMLDLMLKGFQAEGLLKARGQQRSDSTHVLAAVREMTRVEFLGETLRYALNALAEVAPIWLGSVKKQVLQVVHSLNWVRWCNSIHHERHEWTNEPFLVVRPRLSLGLDIALYLTRF